MTRLAASLLPSRFSPSGLRWNTRALHRPRVLMFNVGWLAVAAGLALSVLGIAAIATTSPEHAMKNTIFTGAGLLGAVIISLGHYQWLQRLSYVLLALVLLALIFVLIPWVPDAIVHPRNGSRRWINLGVIDFQPSELAKLAYVIALASYLRYRKSYRTFGGLLLPLVLTTIPFGLVLVEPDLGTALLFFPTFFAMLIAAGAKMKHIIGLIVIGLALAPATYPLLRPHQKDRIQALIAQISGDARFENDIGYQGARALDLVGAGGLTGVGRERAAALVHFNSLPEEHNDMIFAVIACRWGMLGAITVWGAVLLVAASGLLAAAQTKEPFARLAAVGIVTMLFSQMAINTGMVIGVLPITGITLPFISYGGSSMVTAWLMIGLLFNIALRRPRYLARESFQFDDMKAAA